MRDASEQGLDLGPVPITAQEMIEELLRELKQRAVVYPRLVSQLKLSQTDADHRTKVLEEIVALLRDQHLGGPPETRSRRPQIMSDPPLRKRPWPTGMLGELAEAIQDQLSAAGFAVAEIGVATRDGRRFRAPLQPCKPTEGTSALEATVATAVLRLREAYATLLAEEREMEQAPKQDQGEPGDG